MTCRLRNGRAPLQCGIYRLTCWVITCTKAGDGFSGFIVAAIGAMNSQSRLDSGQKVSKKSAYMRGPSPLDSGDQWRTMCCEMSRAWKWQLHAHTYGSGGDEISGERTVHLDQLIANGRLVVRILPLKLQIIVRH